MKNIDIGKLVEGLVIVALFAFSVGQYGKLQDFARREAAESLRGWTVHPFWPAQYNRLIAATSGATRVHHKGAAHLGSPPRSTQPKFKQE